MGVDGFFPLVAELSPEAVEVLERPPHLDGKTVGIDVAMLLHRARSSCSLRWAYIPYVCDRLRWLLDMGADVLCVFDGQHPIEKEEETAKRAARGAAAETALRDARAEMASCEDVEVLEALRAKEERCARSCARPGREDKETVWRLGTALGVRCWRAPGEAEAALALLQRRGLIDEIITEDSDTLVCGASSILRNFWSLYSHDCVPRSPALAPQRVVLSSLLAALQLDQHSLRVACVLAGCDFAPKLRNVGLKKALKAVRRHGPSLNACLCSLKHSDVARDEMRLARFQRAVQLLDTEAVGIHETPLPERCVPAQSSRQELARIIEDVESAGEPWHLRASLRDILAPAARVAIPFPPVDE